MRSERCRPDEKDRIGAPSLSSHAVTIGGSAVDDTGSFTPTAQPLSVTGTTVTVTVPAHSAALVQTH